MDGVKANETAVWYSMAAPRKLDLTAWEREVCGDVDGDGTVDMSDVYLLLDRVGNYNDYEAIADVNCDHKINMGDVVLLLNHINDPVKYKLGCCEEE